jgi:hypothetical protein
LLRLGIHPPDIDHRAIWEQIGEIIREALVDRQATTYGDWLCQESAIKNQQSEMV